MAGIYRELLARIAADPDRRHARAAVAADAGQAAGRGPGAGAEQRRPWLTERGRRRRRARRDRGRAAAGRCAARPVTLVEAAAAARRRGVLVPRGATVGRQRPARVPALLRRRTAGCSTGSAATDRSLLQPRLDIPVLAPGGRTCAAAPATRACRRRCTSPPRWPATACSSPADRARAVAGALALRRLDPDRPGARRRRRSAPSCARTGRPTRSSTRLWGIVGDGDAEPARRTRRRWRLPPRCSAPGCSTTRRRPTSATPPRRSASCTRTPRLGRWTRPASRCCSPTERNGSSRSAPGWPSPPAVATASAAGRRRGRARRAALRGVPARAGAARDAGCRRGRTSAPRRSSTSTSSTTAGSPTCRSRPRSARRCNGSSTAPTPSGLQARGPVPGGHRVGGRRHRRRAEPVVAGPVRRRAAPTAAGGATARRSSTRS